MYRMKNDHLVESNFQSPRDDSLQNSFGSKDLYDSKSSKAQMSANSALSNSKNAIANLFDHFRRTTNQERITNSFRLKTVQKSNRINKTSMEIDPKTENLISNSINYALNRDLKGNKMKQLAEFMNQDISDKFYNRYSNKSDYLNHLIKSQNDNKYLKGLDFGNTNQMIDSNTFQYKLKNCFVVGNKPYFTRNVKKISKYLKFKKLLKNTKKILTRGTIFLQSSSQVRLICTTY